jgi:hypothetical protein
MVNGSPEIKSDHHDQGNQLRGENQLCHRANQLRHHANQLYDANQLRDANQVMLRP